MFAAQRFQGRLGALFKAIFDFPELEQLYQHDDRLRNQDNRERKICQKDCAAKATRELKSVHFRRFNTLGGLEYLMERERQRDWRRLWIN